MSAGGMKHTLTPSSFGIDDTVPAVIDGRDSMDGIKKDRHHRHPKSRRSSFMGDIHDKRNISMVEPKLHRAYHMLFQNRTAQEIAKLLTDVWISPDMVMVAVPRHKPPKKKRRKRCYCVDCECEVLKHIPSTTKGGDS